MGAAAGDITGTMPDAEAGRYRRLNDYRMEHIMLGGAEVAWQRSSRYRTSPLETAGSICSRTYA